MLKYKNKKKLSLYIYSLVLTYNFIYKIIFFFHLFIVLLIFNLFKVFWINISCIMKIWNGGSFSKVIK